MAITAVNLVRASARQSGITITYERVYEVICNSRTDGPIAALVASAGGTTIPPRGSSTTVGGVTVYVREKDVQPKDDSQFVWIVTVTSDNAFDPGQAEEDPLDREDEYEWGVITSMEPKYQDADGNPVENSAHETFDPPVDAPANDAVLRIVGNRADFDPAQAIAYTNAINQEAWLIPGTTYTAQPYEAKVAAWVGQQVWENGVGYWRVTKEIHFREYNTGEGLYGWLTNVRDEGFHEIVNGERVKIVDRDGKPLSSPAKLDGNGAELAVGANAVYLHFKMNKVRPFTGIVNA